MSRSGLCENDGDDNWSFIRWRGAVASALRGKKGQAFLRELLAALDAMPVKRLVRDELQTPAGEVCAIGCLAAARGIDMTNFDTYDFERISRELNVNEKLVQEIEWVNDEYSTTPEERWKTVREWVVENLRDDTEERKS